MTHSFPRFLVLSLATGLALLASSAQSRSKDNGDKITARGETITARGEDWTDGQHDLKKGQKLVASSDSRAAKNEKRLRQAHEAVSEAEHQIEEASADRAKGERLIQEGTAKMASAEAAYSAIRGGPPAVEPQ